VVGRMTWTTLINQQPGHNKFWSYNLDTGEVRWGRIGQLGQSGVFDRATILRREQEKLARGYVYSSTTTVGRRLVVFPTRERTEQTATGRFIDVPEFNRSHTFSDIPTYKTDNKGFLKTFRPGYEKISFDEYMKNITITSLKSVIGENFNILNLTLARAAKKYYIRIPADSQYDKPEFLDLRRPDKPTFVLVFYNNNIKPLECVGIYGVRMTTKTLEFMSLKMNVPYRKTLMKEILKRIGSSFSIGSDVLIKIKNENMRQFIKDTASFYIVTDDENVFRYKSQDLQRIPSSNKATRWLN